MSDELITGTSFYQFEPLIARLRGIIRDYFDWKLQPKQLVIQTLEAIE